MATKTRLMSGHFRIQFRQKGLKLISRTFTAEPKADAYQARIESELLSIRESEKAKHPIDMAALNQTLPLFYEIAMRSAPMRMNLLRLYLKVTM